MKGPSHTDHRPVPWAQRLGKWKSLAKNTSAIQIGGLNFIRGLSPLNCSAVVTVVTTVVMESADLGANWLPHGERWETVGAGQSAVLGLTCFPSEKTRKLVGHSEAHFPQL